jgi:hypothetical protein
MHIVKEAKVGDKIWLGETQYEIIEQARDHKRKLIAGTFVAQPCAWTDRILSQPENIRKGVQKTESITIVFPLKVWDYDK